MAVLLDIRRTEPMVDLNQSESSVNLTSYAHEPVSFGNPTFQDDFEQGGNYSPTSPTVTLLLQNIDNFSTTTNNNDNALSDQNNSKSGLTPSDSGILICVASNNSPNDDSSSLGDKSLDSGVYEATIGNSALDSIVKAHPGGEGDTWPTLPKDKDPEQGKKGHGTSPGSEESLLAICVQVFIPFLIAGTGTCGAGIVLDYVEERLSLRRTSEQQVTWQTEITNEEHLGWRIAGALMNGTTKWEVFQKITELFILVPTLLGLKGNLEMTLASRVSTQANLGKLNSFKEQWQMCWGNMALIQCQATVMGLLAATFATVMSIANGGFNIHHALLLSASSLFTASLASLVLGAITLAVVVLSHKCNINPDNVATPIAASLGDVTTLALLAAISGYLYQLPDKIIAPVVVVSLFLVFVPVWAYLSYKNPFVKQVLYSGWIPVILAVVITSAGGYILEFSVTQFKGFAIFQPVINGVAGNLVAVQASRISTYFHQNSEKPGSRPPDGSALCVSPFTAFFGKSAHARTARILMLMVIPGHLLFGYGITLIKGGNTVLTATFLPIYLISAFIQIALLLYIAQCLIQILWRFKIDPDNSAIPLLTALGDLSGMTCLTIAFLIHQALFSS